MIHSTLLAKAALGTVIACGGSTGAAHVTAIHHNCASVQKHVKYETPSKSKMAELNSVNQILSSDVPIQGKITSPSADAQVYHFSTYKDGEVNITVDQTTGGLYMGLYDSQGKNITDLPIDSRGKVIHDILAKGTYSVVLSPYDWNGISSASYRLKEHS